MIDVDEPPDAGFAARLVRGAPLHSGLGGR
jgi:hypothetical protein